MVKFDLRKAGHLRLDMIISLLSASWEKMPIKHLEFLSTLSWKLVLLRKGEIMSPDVKWNIGRENHISEIHAPKRILVKCPKGYCVYNQRTGYCNGEPDFKGEDKTGENVLSDSDNRGVVICCHSFKDLRSEHRGYVSL